MTTGMNKHLMFKHIDVYRKMIQEANQEKKTSKLATAKIITHKTTDKRSDREMKKLYTVAAATCTAVNWNSKQDCTSSREYWPTISLQK